MAFPTWLSHLSSIKEPAKLALVKHTPKSECLSTYKLCLAQVKLNQTVTAGRRLLISRQ